MNAPFMHSLPANIRGFELIQEVAAACVATVTGQRDKVSQRPNRKTTRD